MRKLFFFLLLFGCTNLYSQDLITMRSGEVKLTKVKKVSLSIVEYVRFDNQSGPIYEIDKAEIHKIKYENGAIDIFNPLNDNVFESEEEGNSEDRFLDQRDGINYKTVKINNISWMAENLKYDDGGSPCLKNKQGECDNCGSYYSYEQALKACPPGWHLPSDKEWKDVEIWAGMNEAEAAKDGWRGTSPGQASSFTRGGKTGLEVFMCGKSSKMVIKSVNDLNGYESDAYFWTSDAISDTWAYIRHFTNRASIERTFMPKVNRISVRCIKD